ncbi:SusC/RagA family TonB-linked outer membrane protein [Reichenbachiella sp. MALMAid0571]|uniref:SusC/RagA family TonB-linked outer membrane protein n=1 Tax=Reichenbachiella sp. MALMAid0571 TaxID=3143939 RepID=UPI0032DF4574
MKQKYIFQQKVNPLFTLVTLGLMIAFSLSVQAGDNLDKSISGKVTSSVDGEGIPGVNVVIKGVQEGTITDIEGNYSLSVADETAVLVFSFVGYNAQEVVVGNRSVVDVKMTENVEQLNEVVVTALGIKREERSLGFSVGRVDGAEANRVAQDNVLNSLSGKVAGVTINQTGGAGSSVSMVIRGASSLSTDNQPLFVVDGVPITNGLNNVAEFGSQNNVDYGNAISDINPDNIESITVLKGPSAAALYGTRAGNGVVLITTKTAAKGDKAKVSFSSNTVFDVPFKFLKTQKKFATGYFSYTPDNFGPGEFPVVTPAEAAGAGMELDRGYYAIQWDSPRDANGNQIPTELVSHPNNVKDFVQTGINTTNSVAVSGSNEIINYRIGYTNMRSRGLIPNADLLKDNFSLNSSIKANKSLTISSTINAGRTWSNNRPNTGNRGSNPLEAAYKIPQNLDINDFKNYWAPGQEGVQQYAPENYNNPYFLANEVKNGFSRDRIIGNVKADLKITEDLSLMGRYSVDYYTEVRETKISPSYTREPNNGAYGLANSSNLEKNIDFLLTYTKDLGDFGLVVSGGGNSRYTKGKYLSNSSGSGNGLIVPNVYSVSNISSGALSFNSSLSERVIYSVYGIANLSYKNFIYLDLTARNDWSSTLRANERSYYYPSTSLSLLLDEAFDLGGNVDMLKLRGGWAKVGNDTSPYNLNAVYNNGGQWGDATMLTYSTTRLLPNLRPETATSWEAGVEAKFLGNRLRLEGTYYTLDNVDQVLQISTPGSSKYTANNINAGLIQSSGWELMLGGTPLKNNDWSWDVSMNLSRNRTKIIELAEGVEFYEFWSEAKSRARTYVGETIGDIYDAKMVVVEDPNSPYYQYPIIGGGDSEWQAIQSADTRNKVGNFNPDFILGMQSTLAWKNFSLSMTLDWRKGGQYQSQTYRYSTEDASSQIWLDNAINPNGLEGAELSAWLKENEDQYIRNGFHIVGGLTKETGGLPENFSGKVVNDGYFIPGVVQTAGADTPNDFEDDVYVENLGESGTLVLPYIVSYPWDFGAPSLFDADFIKLRELSIGYRLPTTFTNKLKIQSANVSVYTRNVIIWTKGKNGIDPERAFQNNSSRFVQGVERYNVEPWVFPIGVKLNLTF